jgi:hypothetical protein
MKMSIMFILGFGLAAILFCCVGRGPIESVAPIAVRAQATTTRPNWITNERQSSQVLINWAVSQVALDDEYTANNYSGTLVIGDFTGANSGLVVADMTTAEGNLTKIANAALQSPGTTFPVSIATGTASTIFKVRP